MNGRRHRRLLHGSATVESQGLRAGRGLSVAPSEQRAQLCRAGQLAPLTAAAGVPVLETCRQDVWEDGDIEEQNPTLVARDTSGIDDGGGRGRCCRLDSVTTARVLFVAPASASDRMRTA